jgi:hypothetical protein
MRDDTEGHATSPFRRPQSPRRRRSPSPRPYCAPSLRCCPPPQTQPRGAVLLAAPPKPRVHAHDGFSSDAAAVVPAVALGLTSTGACLAPFADARGDTGGGVPPLGHMCVAPSPESRVVVGPVRRLTRRISQCEARTARAREPRTLAGLMRRLSRSKNGEGVSPVAAPTLPLTDSLAHAVALGAVRTCLRTGLSQCSRPMYHGTHRTRRRQTRPPRRLRTHCSSTSASPRSSREHSSTTRMGTVPRSCESTCGAT